MTSIGRWMREQGWEVAIIQVDRVSKKIVAVAYRYTAGVTEEPEDHQLPVRLRRWNSLACVKIWAYRKSRRTARVASWNIMPSRHLEHGGIVDNEFVTFLPHAQESTHEQWANTGERTHHLGPAVSPLARTVVFVNVFDGPLDVALQCRVALGPRAIMVASASDEASHHRASIRRRPYRRECGGPRSAARPPSPTPPGPSRWPSPCAGHPRSTSFLHQGRCSLSGMYGA